MNFRLLTSPKNSSLSAAAIPNSWTESVSRVKWTWQEDTVSLSRVLVCVVCSVCSLLQAPGDHWPVETVSSYTRVPVSHQGDCSGLLFTRNPMCIVPDCHFRSRSPGDLQCNYKWIFFTVQWNYCIESVQMMVEVQAPPGVSWVATDHCTDLDPLHHRT